MKICLLQHIIFKYVGWTVTQFMLSVYFTVICNHLGRIDREVIGKESPQNCEMWRWNFVLAVRSCTFQEIRNQNGEANLIKEGSMSHDIKFMLFFSEVMKDRERLVMLLDKEICIWSNQNRIIATMQKSKIKWLSRVRLLYTSASYPSFSSNVLGFWRQGRYYSILNTRGFRIKKNISFSQNIYFLKQLLLQLCSIKIWSSCQIILFAV